MDCMDSTYEECLSSSDTDCENEKNFAIKGFNDVYILCLNLQTFLSVALVQIKTAYFSSKYFSSKDLLKAELYQNIHSFEYHPLTILMVPIEGRHDNVGKDSCSYVPPNDSQNETASQPLRCLRVSK